MQAFPEIETRVQLVGAVGELEALLTPALPNAPMKSAVAVICHPHPLFGGTMNNKVVSTLARAFGDLGLRTVRFNFRGIGKSVGQFADGIGELEDVLAVIKWVKTVCPNDDLWLAGFSFGAAISAFAATKVETKQLVSIAPPVPRINLLELPPVTCPWLIIQGEKDEVVEPAAVYAWAEKFVPPPQLIRMPEATHFFHGKLLELRNILETTLA